MVATAKQLALIFGLLGNMVTFMTLLSPLPTLYTIYKRKSSDGFLAIPFSVGLLSASLTLYYALIQPGKSLLISTNSVGAFLQIVYLTIYLIYASRPGKVWTLKLIGILNVAVLGMVLVLTLLLTKGTNRIQIVGYLAAGVNTAIFVAPLAIIKRVIQTRSVEFMPFNLSFALTVCAIIWFFYGLFSNDYFIAIPNVMGFVFGLAQIFLYVLFKYVITKKKRDEPSLERQEETTERPLNVPTEDHERNQHEEKKEEERPISIPSPRHVDYFTEYHPMFRERDIYLS